MTTTDLRSNVADLLHRPASRRELHLVAPAGVLSEVGGARWDPDQPVRFDGVAERVPDGVVVQGVARAHVATTCSRCLAPVVAEVHAPVRELFEPSPVEGETYLLDHDEIDLEPVVRDALLLEAPTAPRCRDDCAGLCPICGADRNTASCDCDPNPPDPRWDALRALELTD